MHMDRNLSTDKVDWHSLFLKQHIELGADLDTAFDVISESRTSHHYVLSAATGKKIQLRV